MKKKLFLAISLFLTLPSLAKQDKVQEQEAQQSIDGQDDIDLEQFYDDMEIETNNAVPKKESVWKGRKERFISWFLVSYAGFSDYFSKRFSNPFKKKRKKRKRIVHEKRK